MLYLIYQLKKEGNNMNTQIESQLINELSYIYDEYVAFKTISINAINFINRVYKVMYSLDDVVSLNIEDDSDLEEVLADLYNLFCVDNLTWEDGTTYTIVDDDVLKNELMQILHDFLK